MSERQPPALRLLAAASGVLGAPSPVLVNPLGTLLIRPFAAEAHPAAGA